MTTKEMSIKDYLAATSAMCSTCNKVLPLTGEYVKCYNCKGKYHYSPCTTLSESTYSVMKAEKKASWKCQNCRGDRSKSPNNLYQAVVFDNNQQSKKQQREDEDDDNNLDQDEENSTKKKFKDSLSLNTVNSNVTELKADFSSFKSTVTGDMKDIKVSIQQLNSSVTATNNEFREEMSRAFTKLAETMSNLASEVNELKEQNKKKDLCIQNMEKRVNMMEQQILSKNLEIKNVPNEEISANDVIKIIAASVNVDVQDSDISNAYKKKKRDDTITIIEFCSLNKKRELLSKLRGHKVKGEIFNNTSKTNSNNSNNNLVNNTANYIYINDQLSAHNRQLLWIAKTKAKENGWKFVWFRNGHLLAKKNENSTAVLISNVCDLELIL